MGLPAALLFCALRVVVTEVMANPAGGSGALYPEDRNEFVELYNAGSDAVDLNDWALDDGDSRDWLCAWTDSSLLADYPTLQVGHTWLRGGGFAVVLDSEYCAAGAQGGYVRPYRLGDSCLILTTRNTTLGNGLAGTDPVVLISPYGDTSTYGTPLDSSDSLPCDPGDGISWERIDPLGPDTVTNWTACLDSSGCTPGRAASVFGSDDFAVTALVIADTVPLRAGEAATAAVRVANNGQRGSADWDLALWLDRDADGEQGAGERVGSERGVGLEPGAHAEFSFRFTCPDRATDLWAEVTAPAERDPVDNRRRVSVGPGTGRLLDAARARFSPDGDRFEDTLEVRYHLPGPSGWLELAVFDLRGRKVAELYRGSYSGSAFGACAWDGRKSDGRSAAAGIYAVALNCKCEGRSYQARLPIVLFRK
jgi:hypothetical protein